MWAFVGVLARTHTDRGQGFTDLVDMLKDQSREIPLRAEKLKVCRHKCLQY